MKAAVLPAYNQPWELKDLPDPKPGPGQVLIRIEASGFCGTDVHLHHGHLPFVPTPIVCGHEPVGIIEELGAGVTHLKKNDRVGVSWVQKGCGRCPACQSGCERYCLEGAQSWIQLGGGNAELMLAWATGCTLVPDGVSPEAAAPIFCAGYTVMSGLRMADPRPGDRVAIIGVGGLGHIGIELSKALGFETLAVTSSEDKQKDALAFGADDVVLAGEDTGKTVMDAGGVDIIVATSTSAKQISQAIGGLRPEGRLVTLGALDGPLQTQSFSAGSAPRRLMIGTQTERRNLVDALDFVATGAVKPRVETYSMDRINEVLDRQAQGKVRYRAVLQYGT